MPKRRISASIFALFLTITTPSYAQDTFKSSKFLTWPEDSRSFYIRTSVGMAGLISRYNDEAHGICLEKWYVSNEKESEEVIYETMRKFPDYHPRGVIVAVLEKQCGPFTYNQKED